MFLFAFKSLTSWFWQDCDGCFVVPGSGEESAEVIAQLCTRVYPTIEDSTTQATSSDPLPEEIPLRADEGLLGDTMRVVDQSLHSRLDAIVGPTDDMGFQYFTEKVGSLHCSPEHGPSFPWYSTCVGCYTLFSGASVSIPFSHNRARVEMEIPAVKEKMYLSKSVGPL